MTEPTQEEIERVAVAIAMSEMNYFGMTDGMIAALARIPQTREVALETYAAHARAAIIEIRRPVS